MKYVHDLSDEEASELKDALETWSDPDEVRRARAIRWSDRGWTVPEIAQALEVCRRSVRNWVDRYEEKGLEGLRTGERTGRPPKADEHYREALAELVRTPPREMGYPFNRWTLRRMAAHMERETGVSISPGHLRVILDEMGFVYKRPRHDLSEKRDEELYREKKGQLEELKKGPWRRSPVTASCS